MLTLLKIRLALRGHSFVYKYHTTIITKEVSTGLYALWYIETDTGHLCLYQDELSALDVKLLLKTVLKEVYRI